MGEDGRGLAVVGADFHYGASRRGERRQDEQKVDFAGQQPTIDPLGQLQRLGKLPRLQPILAFAHESPLGTLQTASWNQKQRHRSAECFHRENHGTRQVEIAALRAATRFLPAESLVCGELDKPGDTSPRVVTRLLGTGRDAMDRGPRHARPARRRTGRRR